jgi:hypothetical protein
MLLQQASRHGPETWVLRQHQDQADELDLAELQHLLAKKYIELPKKSMALHQEGCWETASWDVYPACNTTQLWKVSASDKQPEVLADPPSDMLQQYLEC